MNKLDLLGAAYKLLLDTPYPSDIVTWIRFRLPEEYNKKDFRTWKNYIKDLYFDELQRYI